MNELMPAEDEVYFLSEFFKVFADSTRIKILFVLRDGEQSPQPWRCHRAPFPISFGSSSRTGW